VLLGQSGATFLPQFRPKHLTDLPNLLDGTPGLFVGLQGLLDLGSPRGVQFAQSVSGQFGIVSGWFHGFGLLKRKT
jgi:hypothetical protein